MRQLRALLLRVAGLFGKQRRESALASLYPALMRLEQRGRVRAEWGVTDNNRKVRFHAITAAGRRQLATERAEWDRIASIMHTLLREQR